MTAIIGALRADLSAGIAQFQSDLGKAADTLKNFAKDAKAISKELEETGRAMSLALTAPLVALGYDSLKAAQNARTAYAQLQAAIASTGNASGKTAEQLQDSAGALRDISTFSKADILKNVTTNLLTFGNVSGPVFDRAQKAILDLSSRLGVDLQSATIKVGRALNDPIQGMTALTRIGVQFTTAQKDQIKALVDSGEGMKAQSLILDVLETKYGGASEALRAATPTAELSNEWEKFTETIGEKLVPALKEFADVVSGLVDWFDKLDPDTQQMIVNIGLLVAAVGPLLIVLAQLTKAVGVLAGLFTVGSATVLLWVAAFAAAVVAGLAVGVVLGTVARMLDDIFHGQFSKAADEVKDSWNSVADTVEGAYRRIHNLFTGDNGPQQVVVTPQVQDASGKGAGFDLHNDAQIKAAENAAKAFQQALINMGQKIDNGLGTLQLPKATAQANALNVQIDDFVKKANDAGVNTDKWADKIAALRARIAQLQQVGLQKEAEAFSKTVDADAVAVDKLAGHSLPPLAQKLMDIKDAFDNERAALTQQIEDNKVLAESNDLAKKKMADLVALVAQLTAKYNEATAAATKLNASQEKLADLAAEQSENDTRNAITDLQRARGDTPALSSQQSQAQAIERQHQADLIRDQENLATLNQQLDQAKLDQDDAEVARLNTKIALAQQLYDLDSKTSAEQLDAAKRTGEAFTSFADSISSDLDDMLMNWDGSLKGLMNTFKQLANQLFLKPITDQIGNSMSSMMQGMFNGTGGGAGGAAGAGASSGFMSFLSNIGNSFAGMFADGGTLNPGEWGIAGENGPEPVFGGAAGMSVMSNDMASRAGRGGGVTIYQNISTPNASSFNASARQVARQAKREMSI